MFAKLTPDNKFIILEQLTTIESTNIKGYFTKNIPNWFIIKRKNPHASVESAFINNYNMIPSGLWLELVNACKKFNYPLTFSSDFNCRIKNCEFNEEQLLEYTTSLFKNNVKNIQLAEHQIKSVNNILAYKNCCIEVSTGGGKTIIAYLLFKFLIDNNICKHVLYVTPSTPLTRQSAEKFIKYDNENQIDINWTYSEIHSDAKKKKEYNDTIIFGNYQSLCKKKKDFFEKFDCVIIDECAHAKADSIKNILKKCSNAKYKVGCTGTFPKTGTYESFVIQSYIGPVIYKYTSYELINDTEFATPVHVYGMLLNYLSNDNKKKLYEARLNVNKFNAEFGSKVLNMEKEIARNSDARFKFICDMAAKTTKNTLILFGDIQNGYGKKIYHHIKEYTDKNVFYVDGTISSDYRDNAKQSMEDDDSGNTIIVASMGTFGEGIDIGNLWNIFLVETTKSDNNLGQILGRGMRYYKGKDKTILVDFGDDFIYGNDKKKDNYLYKHFLERINIYKNRKFPFVINRINLSNSLF